MEHGLERVRDRFWVKLVCKLLLMSRECTEEMGLGRVLGAGVL